jgi:archaemetzincin
MSRREIDIIAVIQSVGAAIAPLHRPIPPPRGNDWLAVHDEPGQTFLEYLASDPVLPTRSGTTLCLQPIGDIQPLHSRAIAATVDLLGRFYGVPIRILDPIGTRLIPGWARRRNPFTRNEQFLTGFLLDHLARDKPTDAVAVLALTTTDLWPGGGWNFVYGEASFDAGVGVWSLYRMGNPELDPMTFLRRTLKIAVHETGHLFGIRHCNRYDCGMNGGNHQEEADRQPMWFCHEEEMKIWYGFGADPAERYHRLAEFGEMYGLGREMDFWRRSERAVRKTGVV